MNIVQQPRTLLALHYCNSPLGPFGFERAHHRQTPRPSVERICSKACSLQSFRLTTQKRDLTTLAKDVKNKTHPYFTSLLWVGTMRFSSLALIASALMACTSLVTGYSFTPAAFSLRAPGGALRTASVARPPRALRGTDRGADAGGLYALSMTAEQDCTLAAHEALITELQQTVEQQNRTIAGLQRRVEAQTKVFTWTDNRANGGYGPGRGDASRDYHFTDGVRGHCVVFCNPAGSTSTHSMGFELLQGPACKMHFKCSVLDKDDKVLLVVSPPECGDFQQPAVSVGTGGRAFVDFDLTAADKARAVVGGVPGGKYGGHIRFRMVVHLFLPE